MRTAQERVDVLHERALMLRRRREQAALARLGTVCGILLVCLAGGFLNMDHVHTGVSPGMYTGATMLFENAGGYVLVAVIAFAVGAVIAAILLRRRQAAAIAEKESQAIKPKGEKGNIL